jgi:hypothetical protein
MTVSATEIALVAAGTNFSTQVLTKILREMAIAKGGNGSFNYSKFTTKLAAAGFTDHQSGPLGLRLDLLESYVDVKPRPTISTVKGKLVSKPNARNPLRKRARPEILQGSAGSLTIVDLTDPVIDPDMACVLFNICLSIYASQTKVGKVIALDEAHNYMGENNAAAAQFTERLLKTVREQRHQGARVVVATQEPSINPRLLDLRNITMVHRCTSPAWYAVLKQHVAALKDKDDQEVFEMIVRLKTGESLLFCPTAAIGMESNKVLRMGTSFKKFRTRQRITADGGRSKLADGN